MATLSADALPARDALPDSRRGVPWKTVVTLAAVLAYADGYWLVSLRGAIGAIERTDHPFASWLRESTAVLPVFVFAVLAALTLALHWFSPRVGETRTVGATALLIVVGGTLVGVAALVASAAYDYQLQSAQLHAMQGMGAMRGHCDTDCLAREDRDSLALQVRGVLLVSRWILLTNLVLVAWVVAIMGGRLKLSTAPAWTGRSHGGRARASQPGPAGPPAAGGGPGRQRRYPRGRDTRAPRRMDRRRAVLHPAQRRGARRRRPAARARTTTHSTPRRHGDLRRAAPSLAVLTYRRPAVRTGGGHPESVGVPDILACSLEVGSLIAAIALLRSTRWLARRTPPHRTSTGSPSWHWSA